jgi:hypothetical protein
MCTDIGLFCQSGIHFHQNGTICDSCSHLVCYHVLPDGFFPNVAFTHLACFACRCRRFHSDPAMPNRCLCGHLSSQHAEYFDLTQDSEEDDSADDGKTDHEDSPKAHLPSIVYNQLP